MKFFKIVLFSVIATVAYADDTEIYTTIDQEQVSSDETNPNVLFILDSSGSMGNRLSYEYVQPPYSSDGEYHKYATSSVGGAYYLYDLNNNWTGYYIDDENNSAKQSCKAAIDWFAAHPERPRYADQFIYRRVTKIEGTQDKEKVWQVFSEDFEPNSNNKPIECKADTGVHGHRNNSSTSKPYADKTSHNWTSDSDKQIKYGFQKYYLVPHHYHLYRIAYDNNALPTVLAQTKLDLMKDTVTTLISKFDDLNFGIMHFNTRRSGGGVVIQAVEPIEDKSALVTAVDNILDNDATPLAKTLLEAYRYFTSGQAISGDTSERDTEAFTSSTSTYYSSPMRHSCQKNYIILLSDGYPYNDGNSSYRRDMANLTGTNCNDENNDGYDDYVNNHPAARYSCLDELAQFMYNTDLNPDLPGFQNITTHTIGFGIDAEVLQQAATAPVNGYQNAESQVALDSAFAQALAGISSTSDSFVAPAVPVSSYNSLQNSDELYFSLFKPSTTTRWAGNIKRYRITNDGTIVDVNDNNAIGSDGLISDQAKSYWSDVTDGSEVTLGGTAGEMQLQRKLYTNLGSDNLASDTRNLLLPSNNAITRAMLKVLDDDARNTVLTWAAGVDVDSGQVQPHNYIGDPLHSRPVIINYGYNDNAGNPVSRLYYTTNLGFLYSNDSRTGAEKFGFIPTELLDNLAVYYENTSYDLASAKPYGLDGEISVWIDDVNNDGIIDSNTDTVMLFMGMRRGGYSYYAFDVTSPDAPVLKWHIDKTTPGFSDLGQTWSKPQVAKVKWRNGSSLQDRTVLFFGGGYDETKYDEQVIYIHDEQIGDAVYMVDALTGDKLWSAGSFGEGHSETLPNFGGSVPSNVAVLDVDADGFTDMLIVITIQGYYFRFDINDEPSDASDFAQGYQIANFRPSNTQSTNTNISRFFNGPDVALHRTRGRSAYLTIATTTGNRTRPKSQPTTDNYVYVLYENDVFNDRNPSITTDARREHLTEITNLTGSQTASPSGSKGWYYKFDTSNKEKGLSPTLTFNGQLIFGTYLPSDSNLQATNLCSGNIGFSRAYQIDVNTGASSLVDDNGNRQPFEQLNHQGIPPAPVVIMVGDQAIVNGSPQTTIKPILCLGSECRQADADGNLKRLYWRELSPYSTPSSTTTQGSTTSP